MLENSKDDFSEFSHLKDEIKSRNDPIKKIEKSLKLYGNDADEKKPKCYGKTKVLLYIGDNPILILGEDSKINSNNINYIIIYSILWIRWPCNIYIILYFNICHIVTKKL